MSKEVELIDILSNLDPVAIGGRDLVRFADPDMLCLRLTRDDINLIIVALEEKKKGLCMSNQLRNAILALIAAMFLGACLGSLIEWLSR